ncbi:MAG: hypothetical protein H8E44_24270 [Planctomycetes bacterium]|nr:hypothetical protein [Planctomycetota bacterium]
MQHPLVCRAGIAALLIGCASFAKSEQPASPEQLNSSAWWLNRAVQFAKQIKDAEARSHANYKLTYVHAHDGDFPRALESAANVSGPQIRVYAFSRIAKVAHENGDKLTCDKALRVAREVAIPAEIGQTNSHMVRLYFELDRSDEAVTFAAALPHQHQKRYAYQKVARGMAKEGRIDEAIAVITRHTPANWRDSGYMSIAQACATASRFDRAIELAEKVGKANFRDSAYDYIAEKLIRAERLDEGKLIALRIQDERKRSDRLAHHLSTSVKLNGGAKSIDAAMAEAATREEKLSVGMLKFAELIADRDVQKAEALIVSLVKIVEDSPREAQVSKFGSFDDSLRIATIKAGYMETAKLLKDAGDEAGAKDRVAKAMAAAKAIESPSLGKMFLSAKLVRGQAALGDTEGAQANTSLFDTELMLSNSKGDLAASCILEGNVGKGLVLAQEVVNQKHYAHGTRCIATALIRVKRFDKLAEFLPLIPDTGHDVRTFREIAQELVKSGNVKLLDQLLGTLVSDAARTQACLGAYDQLRVE